jgi:hypothetical protein
MDQARHARKEQQGLIAENPSAALASRAQQDQKRPDQWSYWTPRTITITHHHLLEYRNDWLSLTPSG